MARALDFFCAHCQEKHSAEDIALDLHEIVRETVRVTMVDLQAECDEKFAPLFLEVRRYCNTEEMILESNFFMIRGSELRDERNVNITEREWTGSEGSGSKTLRCRINATFGNLVQTVLELLASGDSTSGDEKKKRMENYAKLCDLKKELPASVLNKPLYGPGQVIRAVFTEDNVLDYFTGDNFSRFKTVDPEDQRTEVWLGNVRVCPGCGKKLFSVVGKGEETVVLLVGSPRAGKTSCIISIASALRSRRYNNYGFEMIEPDHDQQHTVVFENEIQLYEKGYAVTKTPAKINEVPSYSLLLNVGDQKRVITFVDMPGEFWQSGNGQAEEFFQKYGKLLQSVNAIWYFASKSMIYGITDDQNLLDAGAEDAKIVEDADAFKVEKCFRGLKSHLDANGVRVPPVAVIVTKTELDANDQENQENYNLFPDGDVYTENDAETGKILQRLQNGRVVLKEKGMFGVFRNVRRFLQEKRPAHCQAVERQFPMRVYISMAAYGHGAVGSDRKDKKPQPPTPYHEMLPLIWTMAITGGMPIAHECRWELHGFLGRVTGYENGVVHHVYDYQNPTTVKRRRDLAGQDKCQIEKDIAKNLLLIHAGRPGQEGQDVTYSATRFAHTRN